MIGPISWIYLCVYLCASAAHIRTHRRVGASGAQTRASDSLEFESQARHLMRVLGTELWSSGRTAGAFNHRAISLVPSLDLILGLKKKKVVLTFHKPELCRAGLEPEGRQPDSTHRSHISNVSTLKISH